MPATVYAYKNNNYTKRLGKTSKAFNCVITKELMREHTLQFLITNDNPFYNLICKDNVFECDGQMFDITEIDTESGESNITQIAAEHVSYRLSDFMIPDNYSFVGTLPQIVEDILEQGVNINDERASALFSAGECYDGLGTNPQLEYGTVASEYEPYIEPVTYTANADGSVDGVKSIYPSTSVSVEDASTVVSIEYNRDINKAFAELSAAIISLGGNV